MAAPSGDFDPAEIRDEYRDRVLELVAAKRDGKVLDMGTFEAAVGQATSTRASLDEDLAKPNTAELDARAKQADAPDRSAMTEGEQIDALRERA